METAEWWNLRFKMYSTIWNLFSALVFINVNRKARIILTPVAALMLGDWKDRVLFDSSTFHWSDWILIIASVSAMIYLLRNEYKPRQ